MRLAATLVHDPPLLLLDEPLSGTDPVQRVHLRDVIRGLADEGRTVLVSSHILEEVEELADSIHLMVGGKLAASGDAAAIRQKLNDRPFVVRIDATARERSPPAWSSGRGRVGRAGREGRLRVRSRNVTQLQRRCPRSRSGSGCDCCASSRSTTPWRACSSTWRGAESLRRSSCSPCASSPAAAAAGSCSCSSRCPSCGGCSSGSPRRRPPRRVRRRHHRDAGRLGDPAARHAPAGVAAFGNEVGDRTLVYLVAKPVARWRIVAPKLAAPLVVGGFPSRSAARWRSP